MIEKGVKISEAKGKLGVLLVGLGAVATTFIAGVEAVRKGLGRPFGSLTQMGTIRLGKRTEGRVPRISEFVPLTKLDDLVFGAWDIFEDNAYESASNAGVLKKELLDQLKPELEAIKPMKAVFDRRYVKRLDGHHVKKGKTKLELAEQLIDEIKQFKKDKGVDRLVMVWCGSTEIFMAPSAVHETLACLENGLKNNDENIPSSMVYCYAALKLGIPLSAAFMPLVPDAS